MNMVKPMYGLTLFMPALHVSLVMMGYRYRLILLCCAGCSRCMNNWCRVGVKGLKVHSVGKKVFNGFGMMGSFFHVFSNGCRAVFVLSIVTRFVVIGWLLYQIALAMASWALVHFVGVAAGRVHLMRGCVLMSSISAISALGVIYLVSAALLMIGSRPVFCRFVLSLGVVVVAAVAGVAGGLELSSPVRSL